jgi:hypothetical protein
VKTLVTNYTFSATAKQITFVDYLSLKLDQILLITNVTNNIIIYNFADPTAGGTLVGNVLTLLYNTTTMSDSDRLQIFIDDYAVPATEASLTAVQVKIDNTNTLLNVLTAKQDTFNFDISSVNVNTNELEGLTRTINVSITATNTRLDVLTAVDYATRANQNSQITLLNSLTASTDELEGLTRTVNASVTATNNNLVTFNRQLTGQVLAFNNQLSGQVQTLNTQLTGQLLTINQNVSSTNPRLSSIDTKLTTLINQTDQIEGYVDLVETKLDTVIDNTSYKVYQQSFPNNYRTSQGPVSGIDIQGFEIWSVEGTSFAGYDQYLQIVENGVPQFVLFSQLIKPGENFKFNFRQNGPGQIFIGGSGGSVRNSLTPFSHTPGNNDLYLLVRGT